MSTAPRHLPPHALDDWVVAASEILGIEPNTDATRIVLNLARDVAHDVARPAAPVSTFLLGIAVGQAKDPEAAVAELAARFKDLIEGWDKPFV